MVTRQWKLVKDELYDLLSDPGEQTDVAAQHPEIVARLQRQLAEFRALTGPPFRVEPAPVRR